MTRLTCPGCGASTAIAAGERELECPRCGTAVTLSADAQGFAVVVTEVKAAVRIAVEGELDLVTAPVLARHLESAVARGRPTVEVDLSGVTFMDVRGVGVLLVAGRSTSAAGSRLFVHSVSDAVRRTLRLCDAESVLAAT